MIPRSSEAARLEADYLARLRTTLVGRPPAEIADIVQGVQEHIEDALAEFGGGEVTLVQMARVIERLGSPEAYARDSSTTSREAEPRVPAVPVSSPAGATIGERKGFAALLDKMWWAYLVGVIGLYVPVIDFFFCDIVSAVILAIVLSNVLCTTPVEFRV